MTNDEALQKLIDDGVITVEYIGGERVVRLSKPAWQSLDYSNEPPKKEEKRNARVFQRGPVF